MLLKARCCSHITRRAVPAVRVLFRIYSSSGYSAVCVLCTGDRIMTKWKWVAALRIPAKVMIVNENADNFWLDRGHLRNIRAMALERRVDWRT